MAPKKKTNKKADDWEADLGEAPDPVAAPAEETEAPAAVEEADPEDEFPAGGLMAMLRKKQKKKKGKQVDDLVEGEDLAADEVQDALAGKEAVEASIEDEFAMPDKKGKAKGHVAKEEEGGDDETGADGKVLTKAQKEKLKKEREKQRKKENVSIVCLVVGWSSRY